MTQAQSLPFSRRFRGYLPVIVDVETAGFNSGEHALLEIAAVILGMDEHGKLHMVETHAAHVKPFKGSRLDEAALKFNKIDPFHPFRFAVEEVDALQTLGGLAYGQTVLAKAVQAAGLGWSNEDAHSAIYDAEQTARLFCGIVNRWADLSRGECLADMPEVVEERWEEKPDQVGD